MSGVTESKGGEAAAGAGGDESKQQAIMARWGGAPISAEESVVLGPKNEMGYPPILFFVRFIGGVQWRAAGVPRSCCAVAAAARALPAPESALIAARALCGRRTTSGSRWRRLAWRATQSSLS